MSLLDRLERFPESMISPPVEGLDFEDAATATEAMPTQQTYIGREGSVRATPIDYSKKLPEDLAYIGRGDVKAAYDQGGRDYVAKIAQAVVAVAIEAGVDIQSIVDNAMVTQKEQG